MLDALGPSGPCANTSEALQLLVVVIGGLNTALATWLVNRRVKADKRDSFRHPEKYSQKQYVSKRGNPLPPDDWELGED